MSNPNPDERKTKALFGIGFDSGSNSVFCVLKIKKFENISFFLFSETRKWNHQKHHRFYIVLIFVWNRFRKLRKHLFNVSQNWAVFWKILWKQVPESVYQTWFRRNSFLNQSAKRGSVENKKTKTKNRNRDRNQTDP